MQFQTYFTDSTTETILKADFSSDYQQVYKTELVDEGKAIFLTTFGLKIDRSKYKMQPYSDDICFEKVDYDSNDYSDIDTSLPNEGPMSLNVKYDPISNVLLGL